MPPAADAETETETGTETGTGTEARDAGDEGAAPAADAADGKAEEETADPGVRVTITSSNEGVVREGEIIVLTANVEGLEGYEVMYQWECDQGDGFRPVYGANEDTYSFAATGESMKWNWRLKVYYR